MARADQIGGCVYFVRDGDRVKIGTSGDVKSRVRELPGQLVGLELGSFSRERALHRRFQELALGHEWFRWASPLSDYVSALPPCQQPKSGAWMTPRKVAEIIGVSAATISQWADKGYLKAVRTPGGRRRFQPSDVQDLRRAMGFYRLPPDAQQAAS